MPMNTPFETHPATATRTATRNPMHTDTTARRFAVRNARNARTEHTEDLRASQLVNVADDEIA
jgi:hypothetical protein